LQAVENDGHALDCSLTADPHGDTAGFALLLKAGRAFGAAIARVPADPGATPPNPVLD
jgi:hypothetical protein